MIKILYIRDKFGKNKATVAYDLSNKHSGNVNFSVACCNSEDQFSKTEGISIANARLAESPVSIGIRQGASNAAIVKSILTKISRSVEIGSCSTRKLARKMLKRYQQSQDDDSCCYSCFS